MADSPEKVYLAAVRTLLSELDAFQSFCGVEGDDEAKAAAALARVHIEAVSAENFTAPGALLQLYDARDARRSSGTGWSYWPKGMVHLELRGLLTIPAVVEEGEQPERDYGVLWCDFMERARQVKWELSEAATTPGGVQFVRHVELQGPELLDEEQWRAVAEGAVGSFTIVWGFQFELGE